MASTLRELVGIVGERVEILALQDDGVAVFVGAGVGCIGVDGDLLLLDLNDEGEGEAAGLSGLKGDAVEVNGPGPGRGGGDGPDAGREAGDAEVA